MYPDGDGRYAIGKRKCEKTREITREQLYVSAYSHAGPYTEDEVHKAQKAA